MPQTTSTLVGPLGLFLLFIFFAGIFVLGGFFLRERRIKNQLGEHRNSEPAGAPTERHHPSTTRAA